MGPENYGSIITRWTTRATLKPIKTPTSMKSLSDSAISFGWSSLCRNRLALKGPSLAPWALR